MKSNNVFQTKLDFPTSLSGKASTDQSEPGKDSLRKGA